MQSGPVSDKKITKRTTRTVILVVIALLLMVSAYFLSQYLLGEANKRSADEAQQVSTQAAQEMVDLLNPEVLKVQKALADLAAESTTTAAFIATDVEALKQLAEQKKLDFEHAMKLRFYLPGKYDLDYESVPKIGFASIELLKRTEQSKLPSKIEVHNPGTVDEHVVLVQPVLDESETVIGNIHLSLSPAFYKSVIQDFVITDGYLALEQSVIGGSIELINLGNASFKQGDANAKVKIVGTQWRFSHWSAIGQQQGLSNTLLMSGLAALFGVIAGAWWFFSRKPDEEDYSFIEDEDDGVIYQGAVRSIMEGAHPGVEKLISNLPKIGQARSIDPIPEPVAAAAGAADLLTDDTFDITGGADEADSAPPPPPAPEPEPPAPSLQLDPKIFRAYDIRGIVGHTFNADVVEAIGQAIGSEAKDRQQSAVAVGRDGRSHGPELAQALIKGIAASGMNVIDVGMVPTPVLYFAAKHLEIDSGVMLTGSHNPPDYNGMKIVLGGDTLSGTAITGLRERIENGNLHQGHGEVSEVDVKQDYLQRITNDIPVALGRSFKLVIDAGNGVAGELAPQLYKAMGHDVIEQYCEVDGSFPNHHPDPSQPSNMEDLIQRVKQEDADLGFAFDGDGDRLGVVDKTGNIIWPDRQMILLAQDVLSRNPGANIIFDVKCSRYLTQAITDAGGTPLMWKTGHSLIKAKMKEVDSPLAGEMSGHIFFKERWYGFDDALYTGARMLEILLKNEMTPTEVFALIPEDVSTPELRVRLDESEHAAYMQQLKSTANFSGATIADIDGLRADYADGWGLVRPSNTSPYLVMRFEAEDEAGLHRIKEAFRQQMLAVKADLELPF